MCWSPREGDSYIWVPEVLSKGEIRFQLGVSCHKQELSFMSVIYGFLKGHH